MQQYHKGKGKVRRQVAYGQFDRYTDPLRVPYVEGLIASVPFQIMRWDKPSWTFKIKNRIIYIE